MDWWILSVMILGGLAIFLHGMTVMTDALKAAAGSRMKGFLKSMTKNRWTSLLAGTGITAVIQSSSVTTVLAVGFVSAGLLSFQSTMGLILGANLGTTITAQIIAFKITKASWLMVAFGYLVSTLFSKRNISNIGGIILGLGLVFLGMNVMSEATGPLKTYEPFISLMKGLDNYFWGILIGIVFTAAVQSSSATTGIVIVLATQNLISTDAGIAIIFGANIGTCVTAVLSALGKPKDAMRVAFSHVFFNVAGVLIWFLFIPELQKMVAHISPNDIPRQIANAHTLFNLANTILFIGMVKPVSKLVLLLLPESKKEQKTLFPELHTFYLENSSMALEIAKNSIRKLGEHLLLILDKGLKIALSGTEDELQKLRKKDDIIDKGHTEILLFLQQVQAEKLSKKESRQMEQLIEAVNIMEATADLITTDLVEAASHRINENFITSDVTREKLTGLYRQATGSFRDSLYKFANNGGSNNDDSLDKDKFKQNLLEVRSYLTHRLAEKSESRISIYRFESEILETIRRLHGLARRLNRKNA